MRVLSSPQTIACTDQVMLTTIDTYFAPNKTVHDLREVMATGAGIDPLKEFGNAARKETRHVKNCRCWPYDRRHRARARAAPISGEAMEQQPSGPRAVARCQYVRRPHTGATEGAVRPPAASCPARADPPLRPGPRARQPSSAGSAFPASTTMRAGAAALGFRPIRRGAWAITMLGVSVSRGGR